MDLDIPDLCCASSHSVGAIAATDMALSADGHVHKPYMNTVGPVNRAMLVCQDTLPGFSDTVTHFLLQAVLHESWQWMQGIDAIYEHAGLKHSAHNMRQGPSAQQSSQRVVAAALYLINCQHVQLHRVHGGNEVLDSLSNNEHGIWALRRPAASTL